MPVLTLRNPAFVGFVPSDVFATVDQIRAESIARAGAAKMTATTYRIERIPSMDDAWFLFKKNDPDPYTVNLAACYCTCDAYAEHGYCKHLEWLPGEIQRQRDEENARAERDARRPVIGRMQRPYSAPDAFGSRMAHDADLIEAFL